jgi:hypothetical protein
MVKKRLKFNEFNVPIPKGHKRIIDKDENTEYLFINAPNDIYTVYFHSGMPLYEENILNMHNEGSMLEIKLNDRKINFFCPTLSRNRKDGLWFFSIEFFINDNEVFVLPGQILLNSDDVYRKTVEGKLPFVKILEDIQINIKDIMKSV